MSARQSRRPRPLRFDPHLLVLERCIQTGKVCFSAPRAREVLADRRSRACGEERLYRCHFCGAYHLTSQPMRATA